MIVVDANVILYFVIPGDFTAKAEALARVDSGWIAPMLWRYEVTSAVTTMVRAKVLDRSAARTALLQADELMTPNEYVIEQPVAFEAALRWQISAYDAQYVALAERKGLKCVTADGPLIRKAPHVAVSLDDAIGKE